MSEDKTNDVNVDNDELTDDELESVTGGRRLATVAAGDMMKTGPRAVRTIKPVGATAVTAAKQVASAVNMKNIQTSVPPAGLKPGVGGIPGALDDRE